MTPAVARLGLADAGELLTLQRAAWVSEGIANDTFSIPPLTETLLQVQADLTDAGTSILGLREAGRLLATVRTTAGLAPSPGSSPGQAGWAYLGRLGVVPDRQGSGLGEVMLQAAEAHLSGAVTRLWLTTGAGSTANHAFYARRGWTFHPEQPNPRLLRMVKVLSS